MIPIEAQTLSPCIALLSFVFARHFSPLESLNLIIFVYFLSNFLYLILSYHFPKTITLKAKNHIQSSDPIGIQKRQFNPHVFKGKLTGFQYNY